MSINRLTSSIEWNDFARMRADTISAGSQTFNALRWTGVRGIELNESSLAAINNFLIKSGEVQTKITTWDQNEVTLSTAKIANYTTHQGNLTAQITNLTTQISGLMVPPVTPANTKAAAPLIKMRNEMINKQLELNNQIAEATAELNTATAKYTTPAQQANFETTLRDQRSHMQEMKSMSASLKMTPTAVEKTLDDAVTKKRFFKWQTKIDDITNDFFDGTAWTGAVRSIANAPKWVSINPTNGEISINKIRWKNLPEEMSMDVRVAAPTTVAISGWVAQATHTKRYTIKLPQAVQANAAAAAAVTASAARVDAQGNPIQSRRPRYKRLWWWAKRVTAHGAHATASVLGTKPMMTALAPVSAVYQAGTWAMQWAYRAPRAIKDASKESFSETTYGSFFWPLRLPGNLLKYTARWTGNILKKVKRGTRDSMMSQAWWSRNRTKAGQFAFGNAARQHVGTTRRMFAWKPGSHPAPPPAPMTQ